MIQSHIIALSDKDSIVRENSAYILGEIAAEGNEIAANTLKNDKQIEAMNAMHKPEIRQRVVDGLVTALQDDDPWVRGNAAEALGKIRDESIIPYLMKAIDDKNALVRATAADALGLFSDDHSTEALIGALKDEDWNVRFNAVKSLGQKKDTKVLSALKLLQQDSNYDVRIKTTESINMIKVDSSSPAQSLPDYAAKKERN